jgi:hypothetical protein
VSGVISATDYFTSLALGPRAFERLARSCLGEEVEQVEPVGPREDADDDLSRELAVRAPGSPSSRT